MRRFVSLVIVAVVALMPSSLVSAATSSTPEDSATSGAAWLISQVRADGSIGDPYAATPGDPSYGLTAQAVLALAATGQGASTVATMQAFLADHVDAYVRPFGEDRPAELALLVLVAVATGDDPTNFGGTDLVARLEATQRADGLFGLAAIDPTYDGVYRQSLSLLALDAVERPNAAGLAWLVDQQCADGSYVAYRADTSVPCPPLDLATYTGPDTNSTALAAIALHTGGADAALPVAWLDSVRTADGGFTYFGDPTGASDANSTGLVLTAITTVTGVLDADAAAALQLLQISCDNPVPDARGAFAFLPQDGDLYANEFATIQALWGLSAQAFPLVDVTLSDAAIEACAAAPVPSTTTTTLAPASTTPTTLAPVTDPTVPPSAYGVDELPRTGGAVLGSDTAGAAQLAAVLVLAGAGLVLSARRRSSSGR